MLNVTKKMMFVALALVAVMVFVPAALANGPLNGVTQPDSPMIGRGNGQGQGQGQRQGNQDNRGPNYVDEDGDGVCDNCDGDRGPNYTDEDGDGVCDNCDGDCDGQRPQDGTGQKRGQGRR